MEKEISLLSEGERMTPIMQKIADLKSAITRYNRVSACEKCKIAFAYGIITFADEAIEKLEVYLDQLKHNVCHDALPLTMIKEWLENTNWIDKDERLYKELHDYATKPLSAYNVVLGLEGVIFTDTLHMYRTIVERIRRILELLSEIEIILKAPNPELYEIFYHNLRVNYNEKEAVDFMDNWLSHSGVLTLKKLLSLRAQKIADFVNGDTLRCALDPSGIEWDDADVEGFKKQLPHSYPYKDLFDEKYVIFCRTIRQKGNTIDPNYSCAGLFIFQHWNELTEEQINSVFYLDEMLEQIQEEIQNLPEADVTGGRFFCDIADVTKEPSPCYIPDVLATPEAMRLWEKTQKAGYVDEHFQPICSRPEAAILAFEMAKRLGIKDKWKAFETLWGRRNMYRDYHTAINQKKSLEYRDKVRAALG